MVKLRIKDDWLRTTVRWSGDPCLEHRRPPFDFFASQDHFIDHLLPIYKALGPLAGTFYVVPGWLEYAQKRLPSSECAQAATIREVRPHPQIKFAVPPSDQPIIVAGSGDIWSVAEYIRPIVLLEHGCGLSFSGRHAAHSGGHGSRRFVNVFLMTNEYCASRDRAVWETHNGAQQAKVFAVGAPKLDQYADLRKIEYVRKEQPVVCYTTHFDSLTVPETRSAFPYFRGVMPKLKEAFPGFIMHSHPRERYAVQPVADELGVEFVVQLEDVFKRADLLIGDAGSAPYEFASFGKPVVLCNAPWYRKNINHGLRFWRDIPGLQCDFPETLVQVVQEALNDPPGARLLRVAAIEKVYPNLKTANATAVAVQALKDWCSNVEIAPVAVPVQKARPLTQPKLVHRRPAQRVDIVHIVEDLEKAGVVSRGKRLVLTGCATNHAMLESSADTHIKYAIRCQADFLCMDQRAHDAGVAIARPHFVKLYMFELFQRYDRILWLDADTLVAPTAPNIFDEVPEDKIGAWCQEYDFYNDEGRGRIKYRHGYFNSGVLLVPKCSREFIARAYYLWKERNVRMTSAEQKCLFGEQTALNKAVDELNCPLHPLDVAWNYYIEEDRRTKHNVPTTLETAHIIHFAGSAHLTPELKRDRQNRNNRALGMMQVRERLGW